MSTEYELSIRIDFPQEISDAIAREKQRFVEVYGSGYKSDPHITLYLDRYSPEGFARLLPELESMRAKPFTIALLPAETKLEQDRHRYLYRIGIEDTADLRDLADRVRQIAARFESPLLREKVGKQLELRGVITDGKRENLPVDQVKAAFDPHITLGEVDLDHKQPDLSDIRQRIKQLSLISLPISSITANLYAKQSGEERFGLVEKVQIRL